MDKFNIKSKGKKFDPVYLEHDISEYDIDDVKLSIEETIDAIEKIIFGRSVEKENKI